MAANGLGQLTHFAGQEAGEMYTTQAPHNQVYRFSYDDSSVAEKYVHLYSRTSELPQVPS